ncbi:MAG TPA: hypothetical protein VGI81_03170 [Tepidisphaeraceae bacterium]|jgi:hypothetical protein
MSSDPRDYKLDISSLSNAHSAPEPNAPSDPRPFLSVLFACCNVYQRIYKVESENAYRGLCPKCGRSVHFPIGQGGTAARFFQAE